MFLASLIRLWLLFNIIFVKMYFLVKLFKFINIIMSLLLVLDIIFHSYYQNLFSKRNAKLLFFINCYFMNLMYMKIWDAIIVNFIHNYYYYYYYYGLVLVLNNSLFLIIMMNIVNQKNCHFLYRSHCFNSAYFYYYYYQRNFCIITFVIHIINLHLLLILRLLIRFLLLLLLNRIIGIAVNFNSLILILLYLDFSLFYFVNPIVIPRMFNN